MTQYCTKCGEPKPDDGKKGCPRCRALWRQQAEKAKRRYPETRKAVRFPAETINLLRPEAARRGIHVNALVRSLIKIITEDDMIDAILDDKDS